MAMAMATAPEVVSDVSKSVTEMAMDGDQPPAPYIYKESKFGSLDFSPPYGQFPVIDISLFSPSSSSSQTLVDNQLDKLRSALTSTGCFQAIGHGISSSFLDKVREVGKQFFELPMAEKERYSRSVNDIEGYGTNRVISEKQVRDWSNRLSLAVFPEDKIRFNFWPENPNDFREILSEYAKKIKMVEQILLKAMAKSVKLEDNSFLKLLGDRAPMQARFNFYPPCSRPDLVIGVKPHTDGGGITLLLQDKEIEGLQVLVDGKWFRVPVIPHALVINVGDQMQIMSNGIFKSPIHRVVTNSESLRMSVTMLNEPEPEKEIGPADGLVNEERPRLYKSVRNFRAIVYDCYQKDLIALDTIKL